MRLITAAALAALASPGLARADTPASPLAAPRAAAAPAPSDAAVRIAMRKETLAPGGELAEHRPEGERYLFVVSGRLKVSDLVTGDEQLVEPGKMAAERTGDWHLARVVGDQPVVLYIIDRTPEAAAATTARAGRD